MAAVSRAAATRRELPASRHIPYSAHVAPEVVVTTAGDYVQTLKLGGASFESADDETLNNWHERLNITWRNVASPNVSLWTHIVRRHESITCQQGGGGTFADLFVARYRGRLARERLMVNDLYLTLVFRPVAGAAPGVVSRFLN